MKVITFSGNLPSIGKSNDTTKVDSASNQEVQISLPAPKLTMPSSELLKVTFMGNSDTGDKYSYPNDYKIKPYLNDIVGEKVSHDDIKPGAELSGLNLKKYNFFENGKTDIRGIKLRNASLSESYFKKAQISDEENRADFTDATCKKVVMEDSKLTHAKAIRANFWFSEFYNVDLSHSDFRGGKFDFAGFKDGTNLDNADFSDAWVLNANFVESVNLDTAKFDGAYYNRETKFPKWFKPAEHDMIFIASDDQGIRNEKLMEYLKTIEKYDKEI
jgi:hypothetical protein